ncbi:hypothetical protein [Candidatus Cyanaurora vandensis]|uniref:hypothetical protein n=1 Tax=Candidatus Cyanaurora vandensis TaxID=2714958 RepID=UPI00257F48B9|nr:hypothetical protein [Candidatus Cyanaurora vandensis]
MVDLPTSDKWLFSLAEASRKSGLSVAKLRKDILTGRLYEPVLVRIGSRVLVHPELFYCWLTQDCETLTATIAAYLKSQARPLRTRPQCLKS